MPEILAVVGAFPGVRHRVVDVGRVHTGGIVDHPEADRSGAVDQEPDEHVGGPGVDAVVDEVRDGRHQRVVTTDR